ncbi:sensor histidine kinase [Anaerosphaera multitolerans]|nr:GHKL domain-containing protein [Anaerosphaera multitolerans]
MKIMVINKEIMKFFSFIAIIIFCSFSIFLLFYKFDNKYTHNGPQPKEGELIISPDTIDDFKYTYLIDDWEIYYNKLLGPDDFLNKNIEPDDYTSVGQDVNFIDSNNGNELKYAIGSTYRIIIKLPPTEESFIFEIPKTYCTYKLYINGVLMGELDNNSSEDYYSPNARSFKFTVSNADAIEVIIAIPVHIHIGENTSNPLVFGKSDSVETVANIRFLIRSFIIAFAISVALFNLVFYKITSADKENSNTLFIYYLMFCFFFSVYISIPIIELLSYTRTSWLLFESLSFPITITIFSLIQNKMMHLGKIFTNIILAIITLIILYTCIVYIFFGNNLNAILISSNILNLYTYSLAIYLFLTSIRFAYRKKYPKVMLIGTTVLITALLFERLFPNFESIYSGHMTEISGTVLIISIGIVFTRKISAYFKSNLILEKYNEDIIKMLDMQKSHYSKISKKNEILRAAHHDFRHHLFIIYQLSIENNTVQLKEYIESLNEQAKLQTQVSYCNHYIIDTLLKIYATLGEEKKADITIKVDIPDGLPFEDIDICVILSNLLENALKATQKLPLSERKINIHILSKMNYFGILVDNTFDALVDKPKRWLNKEGIGLSSINYICSKYNGKAKFYTSDNNIFHGKILLPLGNGINNWSDL